MKFEAKAGKLIGLALAAVFSLGAAGTRAAQTPSELRIVEAIQPAQRAPKSRPRDRSAYLLVYFKDDTHSVHFAVSEDGYSFTDVNDGSPVFDGRRIAEQRGIRDPSITRGPDGAFYLAMTDLHINAMRAGLRATEWERPAEEYGWGNNRSLIFMKSFDLIHWTHAQVRIDRLFPALSEIGAAWAPEVTWDPAKKAMMVHFSTRQKAAPVHMVYSYADPAFTTLTQAPRDLFAYPKPGVWAFDSNITKVGGKYHLFYATNEPPGLVRGAVSDRIDGGYAYDSAKVDPESVSTEGPSLWRRHGTSTWVVMYDVWGAKPVGNMGFSETTDFVHFRDLGHFNDPGSPMRATNFSQPKHGAVTPISREEARRLREYFKASK